MEKGQFITAAALMGALALQQHSHAAIDEAGMKYVSASEGFGGSIRLNFLHKFQRTLLVGDGRRTDHPRDENEWETNYSSSRLYLNGDIELGNNWQTTYYFEIRPNEGAGGDHNVSPGQAGTGIGLAYQDIGLRGPFGWLRLGTIESASSAMVPSADRTNDIGTSGSNLAEDYDNGLRWTSPSINGFQLGASFRIKDRNSENIDNSTRERISKEDFNERILDQWDLAAIYSPDELLELGFSYAQKSSNDKKDEDASGFKIGVSHSRKNWGVSYNFHRYKALNPHGIRAHQNFTRQSDQEEFWHYREYNSAAREVMPGNTLPNGVLVRTADGAVAESARLLRDQSILLDFNKHTTYLEHVVGANFLVGKFNFAVNYSIATTENKVVDTSPDPGLQSLAYEVKSLRGDIGYNLGSKSRIIMAAKSDKFDEAALDENVYYLMYRVDF